MQVIIQFLFDKVIYKTAHRRPVTGHILRTQLGFGLGFKYRLLYFDSDGRYNRWPHTRGIKLFLIKLADGFYNRFAEGRLVRPALGSMLPVHKGIIFLAVLLPV